MDFRPAIHRRAPIAAGVLAIALCAAGPFLSSRVEAAGGASVVRIDYTHPEAFRQATWIDVEIPDSHVTLRMLRVLTGNRSWMLEICGSSQNPATCSVIAGDPARRAPGWRGDFNNPALNLDYTDLLQQSTLHLRVTPMGGDWMIFRVQIEAKK